MTVNGLVSLTMFFRKLLLRRVGCPGAKPCPQYHAELFDFIRHRTGARIFFHTCGSVYRLLPDLIDAGVEVLNPVQV